MKEIWHITFSKIFFFIFLTLLGFNTSQSIRVPAYLRFTANATEFPIEDYYDYIIVGGGTAGCPLAATLSQNFKVLVLERGGVPYVEPNLMTQDGFLSILAQGGSSNSPGQSFTSTEGVQNIRGRVLGGSSAINAGFYSRADQEFYQKSGLSWDFRMVNESYEWVEKAIVFWPKLNSWQSSVRKGLLEAGVNPYNYFNLEHVLGTKIGGTTFDPSGRRHTAAELLNFATTANIKVALHAYVERVTFAPSSATDSSKVSASGVLYRDSLGRYHHALVREKGEVILSAGAIGSPHLLLLSGVGSRSYLTSWGIPVSYHSPYVGQFLYDNPRNGISILPPKPIETSLIQVVGITKKGFYIEAATNVIPIDEVSRSGLTRSPFSPRYVTVATIMEKISSPVSAGSLQLASTDVRRNPIIRFNYFKNRKDLQTCISGMRKIWDVLRSPSMERFKIKRRGGSYFRFVGPAMPIHKSNLRMAQLCQRTLNTIWHYHGGCVVGKVVDANLRVVGINNLRVVDGSIFTHSPGTNPQATLLMLGRYMGLKLIQERQNKGVTSQQK